jgi:hypothetical protein
MKNSLAVYWKNSISILCMRDQCNLLPLPVFLVIQKGNASSPISDKI